MIHPVHFVFLQKLTQVFGKQLGALQIFAKRLFKNNTKPSSCRPRNFMDVASDALVGKRRYRQVEQAALLYKLGILRQTIPQGLVVLSGFDLFIIPRLGELHHKVQTLQVAELGFNIGGKAVQAVHHSIFNFLLASIIRFSSSTDESQSHRIRSLCVVDEQSKKGLPKVLLCKISRCTNQNDIDYIRFLGIRGSLVSKNQ
mmetsp:Transcript_10368/g.19636  ORF Transcript_10368/g.19636 Transcript_10368/m.19636 type:complete len:200 (-) Transcript_10368:50-649(-)